MPAAASNPFVLLTSPNHCKLGVTKLVVEILGDYFTGTCDVSFGYDVVDQTESNSQTQAAVDTIRAAITILRRVFYFE